MLRFVVVAEDELGFRLASDLTDRVVMERGPPWLRDLCLDRATRDLLWRWTGFHTHQPYSPRSDVKRLAEEHSISAHGHDMKAERAMVHKAANIVAKLTKNGIIEKVDALFFVHDTDGDKDMSTRLRDGARAKVAPSGFGVIVATPHPESEAWVVAGALPASIEHKAERRRLGFDPITHPERLSSRRATDKHDAKRVCQALVGGSGNKYEQWERCWMATPLAQLEENAGQAGLRDYTRQIEEIILPLFGHPPPR